MAHGRLIAATITVFLAPVLTACTNETEADLKRGRQIAQNHCVSCHAIDRDDASNLKEAPPFRTLGQSYEVESLAEALAEGIVTGHDKMPEVKLEPDDINAFLNYLSSIQMRR